VSEISIVIPTRNRGGEAAEAAAAVLRDPLDMELVVVDQSDSDCAFQALQPLLRDPRLRVLRSSQRGASNARNTGVAASAAPILAFTDDDCRPGPMWASKLLAVFRENPGASLVFGRVTLPAGADPCGFAASFEPRERLQRGEVPLPPPDGELGIGANFAIRRDVLARLGGFDALLGPGAPFFKAAEETDLLIRALHAGYSVVNASECEVVHLNVRKGGDVRRLHVTYQLAVGAAFGKHARVSGAGGLRDCLRWASHYARKTARDIVHLRRPHPGVLVYFVSGALLTFRYGIDPTGRNLCERALRRGGQRST
jgi:GT2 family glycosyltransferase